jgi:hypothetical protein
MKISHVVMLLIMAGLIGGPCYAKQDKDKHKQLPPGLQKKVDRGEPLPPGWQKKLAKGEILDMNVYRHSEVVVPLDSHGLVTVRIEGKLIRLYDATREILEILE